MAEEPQETSSSETGDDRKKYFLGEGLLKHFASTKQVSCRGGRRAKIERPAGCRSSDIFLGSADI
jgi:hypothetical protein